MTPPARPVWVERLIAHGDAVGGAEHLVGLDPDELVATAVASTGLDDFGDADVAAALRPPAAGPGRGERPPPRRAA